jgi:hypothetical protein
MNNASFHIEVWVFKLGVSCKNRGLYMSFQHHFIGLDENTSYVEW